jgi:hypothetical protein
MTATSTTRKAIRAVRRHIRTDLEHDFVAIAHAERARIAVAADAVQIHADGSVKREQTSGPEACAPHAEELAERRPSVDLDDTGGIERPQTGAAAGRVHAAEPRSGSAQADRRRHDHDPAVRKELDMHALATAKRCARAGRMHRRRRVVSRSGADRRRHERKHRLHGIALAAFVGLVLAGCGGGPSSSPTISVQPAREFRLVTRSSGVPTAGKPTRITYSIKQPDGSNLTKFKHGAGPHTGVHVIYVRNDLGAIVHHHPHIAADGSFTDTVNFPSGGPYRVVIDVYPQQSTPQPNFQLFNRLRVKGAYTPTPLPPPQQTQTVDGYRFTLHGKPRLHAIQPAFLSFTVTRPDGKPAIFTPWFGALAHAIFFRTGSLDYFHTHVCAQGASGCTSLLGGAKVTGRSSTPGKLSVGVLVPVGGTWRLFLQCLVSGRVLTAPFTLRVR